jgi:peptidoglycan/LPS O-acetylase OafA/YrhL
LSFCVIVIYSLWNGHVAGTRLFDFNAGWGTKNFFGGIPRVVYGFTCGMLLYRLTTANLLPSALKKLMTLPTWKPIGVYAALVLVLTFPFVVKGIYGLFILGFFAPLIVLQGSRSVCSTAAMRTVSEKLGLMSFPIYCLHDPVFTGMKAIVFATGVCDPASKSLMLFAIVVTVLMSFAILRLFDWLRVQQNLYAALNAIFIRPVVRVT